MQLPTIFSEKKSIIIEVIILCVFLGGMYYVYTSFTEQDPTTTSAINEQLLGQNFTIFLKAVTKEQFALDKTAFLNSELVNQLQDFSETISPNTSRGRLDPFRPYDSSRSIR
jgi:hypothetical protein